ncbi:hypothetical protein OG948_36230 (plasmid) [Embleya sp. NBC_00888]|uniref:hypothetical protein n=1 Tax=Embleya sp. NBC_00888 TaxID=2975960 RepID=UPI002F908AB9|nr:hypothetical protein OG948_36230 [Embleya sp. NBC_00888]
MLEVAALDAAAGVPLTDRTRFTRAKITHEPSRDRVSAVHLTRTADAPTDGADAPAWWDEAIRLLPRVMSDRVRPDLGTFVAAATEYCPAHERNRVHAAMSAALGTAPDAEALERGRAEWDAFGRPPSAWLPAWDWSAVLPDPVLAPRRTVLAVMDERVGRPAPDPRVPFDPTPLTPDALGPQLRELTDLAATRGAPECARAVAATPRDERERLIHRLVLTEPGPRAQEPAAVVDALPDDTARRAYLVALAQAFTDHTTPTPDTLSAALTAAAALPTPATGRGPAPPSTR